MGIMSNPAQGVVWDLTPFFTSLSDPAIESGKEELLQRVRLFEERYRGVIVPLVPAPTVLSALQELERIQEEIKRFDTFAYLLLSTDQQNQAYRNFADGVDQMKTETAQKTVFFTLELIMISPLDQERLFNDPILQNYRYYLQCLVQKREHMVSEPEEKVLEQLAPVIESFVSEYNEVNSALAFPWKEGRLKCTRTLQELLSKVNSPSRTTRKRAYEAIFTTLGNVITRLALTHCYHGMVYGRLTEDSIRHYVDPFAVSLEEQQVNRKTTDALFSVVEESYPLAHYYFDLKARVLGFDPFELCDQFAPIISVREEKMYSFDEAHRAAVDAYADLDATLGDLAEGFFTRNCIHAELLPRKRAGAFCAAESPSLPSFVFLNYTGTAHDVSTLAHELGHGIHGEFAKKQTMLNYDPPLTVAETASTFGEAVLFDKLFSDIKNDRMRLSMIAQRIEDIFATIFRQMTLFRFEERAYAIRRERPFNPDELGEAWLASQRPYYGEKVILPDSYRWGWLYIHHFLHTRFYTWTYVFGCLLALSLWQKYQEAGKSFVPMLIKLLEAGGSDSPQSILKNIMGLDITAREFWQNGMQEVRRLIHEAEYIAKKLKLV